MLKVALVHDYLNEFGGAERVLLALSEIWPKAPIYTVFYKEGSSAYERFKDKKIVTSWAHKIPFFASHLHSPLRFLAPLIWNSFDFSGFDVVISSAGWYVTKGVVKRRTTNAKRRPVEICYCHTPPRYLYGYQTSIEWQKWWPIAAYALVVNHFLRVYDFEAAQRVDYFIANSKNVRERIKKFYRCDATVIYPPVDLPLPAGESARGPVSRSLPTSARSRLKSQRDQQDNVELRAVGSPSTTATRRATKAGDYFLVVSRIVGGKGLRLAVEAANLFGFKLKVVGKPAGYSQEYQKIKNLAKDNVEFLGFVSDDELVKLYSGARAYLALAVDEDFGITPVEAMLCGTPVIAFDGGGYRETIIQGKTGLFFDPATIGSLTLAINNFLNMEKRNQFDPEFIRKHALKFSKARFKREILKFIENKVK